MFALFKRFRCRGTKPFDSFDSKVTEHFLLFGKSKFLYFECLIIEAVVQEVQKIRNNCLSTFAFQKVYQMVVGCRQELNQDFTNNTNTRFFDIQKFDIIKIFNDLATYFLKLMSGWITIGHKISAAFFPFLMHSVNGTRYSLVWTETIYTFHENISEYNCIYTADNQWSGDLESRITFQSA